MSKITVGPTIPIRPHLPRVLLALLCLLGSSCSLLTDAVEPQVPSSLFSIDRTSFDVVLFDSLAMPFTYASIQEATVLFRNTTDELAYFPLCGGGIPSPDYDKREGNEWFFDAITIARPAIGCIEFQAVEPGDTLRFTERVVFQEDSLPAGTRSVDEALGEYRLRYRVHSAPWPLGQNPPDSTLLPTAQRVTNSFWLQ